VTAATLARAPQGGASRSGATDDTDGSTAASLPVAGFEQRNRHFDRLVATPGLKWMGQNTNHVPAHPAVVLAMHASIAAGEYQIYAPPSGLEELRAGIVADLGLPGAVAHVTDGAVSALYHIVHTLLAPGDELVTTDPTWKWPVNFATEAGARVRHVPIYGAEHGYRLSPQRLAEAIGPRTRIVYLVDPNNPLGTAATAEEIAGFVDVLRARGIYLIHDCTYRDFAYEHTLAARLYPERTITTYSFSKWLGLAGLRVGAMVGEPGLIARLAAAPPNNLGSSLIAQRAALAGLSIKAEWFPGVLALNRANQARLAEAVARTPGLSVPVPRSNGNFLIVETGSRAPSPEAICAAFARRDILIRQGAYHTPAFGDRFIKISTSVPADWVKALVEALPAVLAEARKAPAGARLF
jgi:aspartate/methionine/tyrosine aminotransferase